MTLIAAAQASTSLLVQIANPALRTIALAGAAGVGLAAFRVKAPSVRLFTWTAVLYVALAMPVLGWILPALPIPMPAFLPDASLDYVAAQAVPNDIPTSQTLTTAPTPSAAREVLTARRKGAKGRSSAEIDGQTSHSSFAIQASLNNALLAVVPAISPSLRSSARWSAIRWSAVSRAIYLPVAFLFLLRLFVGIAFGRRLLRASRPIVETRLVQRLTFRAKSLRLAVIPDAAESEFISVPVTLGALRSTILLPAEWREWDDAKLDAVIAHEVSHVARRDGLTQRLSLLHRAVFWFSPLAWWLDRHLADLAEQASDEAALSGGADRDDYARTLLGFFEALQAAPGRVWWRGLAMAKAGQAEERLERILSWKGSVAMSVVKSSFKKSIAVAVVTLAVPLVYLAASVRATDNTAATPHHVHFAQDQTPAPHPAATPTTEPSAAPEPTPASEMTPLPEPGPRDAPAPAPAALTGTIRGGVSVIPLPPRAPMAPVPPITPLPVGVTVYPPHAAMVPVPPVPPVAWHSQSSGSGSSQGGGFSYHYGYDDDQRFVIVSGKTDPLTMSGTSEDARHVEKLRKSIQGDFIWFERDEKPYIIRDQATIDRARKFWEPEEELGKKQEALGAQQEALGRQQEELGAKMEQVQVNVPDMTAELDKLKAKLQKLGSHATMEQVGDLQSEIGELQSKIGEIQSQAGEQQSKLGEQQGALGEKQGKLGEEQGKLGEQQAELAQKATLQMKQLLDEAIKKGIAQPEL
jgi:beta-lactamase regulating signal transducer with metallopeptidase domain